MPPCVCAAMGIEGGGGTHRHVVTVALWRSSAKCMPSDMLCGVKSEASGATHLLILMYIILYFKVSNGVGCVLRKTADKFAKIYQ